MTRKETDPRLGRLAVVLAAAGFVAVWLFRLLRTWVVSPESLVAQTPDDAYYYFQIALSIARGAGSSFDGLNLTNGYHPLWMMTCSTFALVLQTDWDVESQLLFVRFMLSIQLVIGGAAIALLAWTTWRLLRSSGALALLLAGCATPWVIYGMTDGLESALSQLSVAALLLAHERYRPFALPVRVQDVAYGALLSMAFLARLDFVFLCFAIAVVAFAALPLRDALRKGFTWAVPVVLVAAMYVFLNRIHFGSGTPISGALKTTFPEPHFFAQWLRQHPIPFAAALFSALIAAERLFVLRRWRELTPEGASVGLSSFLAVAGIFVFLHAAYTLLFADWAVHVWHFTAYWPIALVALAWLYAQVQRRFPVAQLLVPVVVLLALAVGAYGQYRFLHNRTDHAFQVRSYEAAAWARENIRAGRAIAMSDAGTFGFFRGGLVVNTDGVVNSRAFQKDVVEQGAMRWLQGSSVDYFAHHAVEAGKVAKGYGEYQHSIYSHLYNRDAGSVRLLEKNELYRSPVYNDGTGYKVFVIWKIDFPFELYRPLT
jgi:hypothetical protein